MKKLLGIGALFLTILASCDKPVVGDHFITRGVLLYFRDSATGAVLIGRSGQPFHPDSVTVVADASNAAANYPSHYAQDPDTAGKYGVHFGYITQTVPDGVNDLGPYAFDQTYYIRFKAADLDTVRFEKAAGADVRFSWNGRFVANLPPNVADTTVNVLK
ncbi:hypothetical protein [Flaviaesturariibacter aridisoli]|uniref:Uncharacterized protein n=1 Tax=Flaviaesturariibacter aridisoli TaxID=2545761 RepID=A0A4R4E5B2_9BACT|nr:hypothetical protein [Flaviaesturariibacter aridisoli]TCZ74197.1 hypothetical protein E0486_03740 [Flaviaesturariibacter aridisoli]